MNFAELLEEIQTECYGELTVDFILDNENEDRITKLIIEAGVYIPCDECELKKEGFCDGYDPNLDNCDGVPRLFIDGITENGDRLILGILNEGELI